MRLAPRKANSILRFCDAHSGDTMLAVTSDGSGRLLWSYHLYDANAELIAECDEPALLPEGLEITTLDGEVLLRVPSTTDAAIQYRLYNSRGFLTTTSDGLKTQIFGFLRVEDK